MTRPLGIRVRLTVLVTVLFGVATGLGSWFVINQVEDAWLHDIVARDTSELELIAAELQAMGDAGFDPFLPVGIEGTQYQVIDASGDLVAASGGFFEFGGVVEIEDGSFDTSDMPGFGPPLPSETGIETELIVDIDGVSLTLTAFSPTGPIISRVDVLEEMFLVLVPLLVAGVALMTWWLTGRALRPVEAITGQVERISDDQLDERVPVPRSRDEIAHLATTMNRMLDRLSASRRRQRRFVSDASHELRNPVATSRTRLEVALAHPDKTDWTDTAAVVLQEQERLSDLIDDLLALARLDEGVAPTFGDVDLDDLVFGESRRLTGIEVDVTGVTPTRVRGDARQLTLAVRNLLANAARHADQRIVVTLTDTDGATLNVDDDGPGIPEEDRERIFERFVRLEDSRSRDKGGTGLGLALVDAVVTTHGGSVVVEESPTGGARFVVRLPASS